MRGERNADIGIAPAPERNSELSFSFLLRDRFVGLVPKTNKLASQKRVRLEALLDYPLIATIAGTSIRLTLERAYQEQGRSLRVTHSVTQHQTIVAMVGAGLGVALLPALSLGETPDVAQLLVTSPQITRDIGVVQRKGEAASAAAREFADAMRERISC